MTAQLKEKLESQGVNLTETLARFAGMETFYEKFLKKFLEDDNYEKLKEAVEAKQAEEAFAAAHTLKGLTGNLGFGALYQAVNPLVENLRAGKMDGADGQMNEVTEKYDAICQIIREEYNI